MLSSEANAAAVEKTVDDLFTILEIQGKTDYLGERVSQLEHSLQCAYLAAQAQADDETIVGSLLHDVGRFISQDERMRLMTGDDGKPLGALSHEVVGEIYLRQLGFSEKVCQLVGAHVMAKRYLTATDPSYYDALSSTSKGTLKYQGGPFDAEEVKKAELDPWLSQKVALRKWDDLAKNPSMVVPSLDTYRAMVMSCLAGSVV